MFWKDTFLENFLTKEAYRVRLFHGTHIELLDSILSRGLINNIFLTPNIERAARYAFGPELAKNPVILELVITKPKRLKKMTWDPLDREEDLNNDDFSEYSPFEETINYIQEALEYFFEQRLGIKIPQRFEALLTLSRQEGLHLFDGINIYKELLAYAAKIYNNDYRFKQNRNNFLNDIKFYFPYGENITDHVKITTTGTFRLNPEYFSILKQIKYDKNLIPPSAIKGIWVREEDYPNIQTDVVKSFGADLLPDEKQSNYIVTRNSIDDLDDIFRGTFDLNLKPEIEKYIANENDLEDLQFMIVQNNEEIKNILERLKGNYFFDEEIAIKINNFKEKWLKLEVMEEMKNNPLLLNDFNNQLKESISYIQNSYSSLEEEYSPFEPKIVKKGLWKRVDINDIMKVDAITENINTNKKTYTKTWGN